MTKAPVALIILDGFGWREETFGNAVNQAETPNFDRYWNQYPHSTMKASGLAVGLPEGQMGNSEVGHTNIGAGRVVYQSITRIDKAIEEHTLEKEQALLNAFEHVSKNNSALHVMGLVSDGGVHSHARHLYALLKAAKANKVENVYVHAFTDGRDVAPDSAAKSILKLEEKMKAIGVGELATVTGRFYAMDRDNRWHRTKMAYDAIFHGEGTGSTNAVATIEDHYTNEVFDEFLKPIVLQQGDEPVGKVADNDAVLFFNFRPDRAIQLARAMTEPDFKEFDRGIRPKNNLMVTMTQYTTQMDAEVLFPPVRLKNVLGEVLADHGLNQLRMAETEKYPHVTFFMNGGLNEEFPGEERVLIPSPKVETYDLKPEMSAYEVGDALLEELASDQFDAIMLNFANADMVGHSGKLEPTIRAVEALDDNLGKVVDAILEKEGAAIIFADHGNADIVTTSDGLPHTAHTTSEVPLIVTKDGIELREGGVLADVAPTLLDLLGIDPPEEMTGTSLIRK